MGAVPGRCPPGSNRALLYQLLFTLLLIIPWTPQTALAALLAFAIGIGTIGIVLLVRLAADNQVAAIVIQGPASSRRSCSPARSRSTRRWRTTRRPSSGCCGGVLVLVRVRSRPRGGGVRPGDPPSCSCAERQGPRENAVGARRIARVLGPRSVWVTAAPEPVVVKLANIQHLATPIRAQLAAPVGAVELSGLLHPTPAVGALRRHEAWRTTFDTRAASPSKCLGRRRASSSEWSISAT